MNKFQLLILIIIYLKYLYQLIFSYIFTLCEIRQKSEINWILSEKVDNLKKDKF